MCPRRDDGRIAQYADWVAFAIIVGVLAYVALGAL